MSDSEAIRGAWEVLRQTAASDPEWAWALFCNISMPIYDTVGVEAGEADRAAAFLMFHLFEHDITTHPRYTAGKAAVHEYAEMRIAAERDEDAGLATTPTPPEPLS